MIEVKNVSKKYRKKLAVDNVSFTVEPGKVTGFLGPNGAGKSTTMRVMLGLDNGSGHVYFDDKPLNKHQNPSGMAGILLEAKAFHPTRKAKNHLEVLAAAGNIPKARVAEVLDIVGLSDVAKKKPGKFSLGMSQRLGIAAAILGKPKYLILDEPANGLDPEGIAWLRQFLKDYSKEGNGVFISSHLLSEIALVADNVVVIGKGKLIADTTVKELTSGKTHSAVFVRSPKNDELKKIFEKAKYNFSEKDGGFLVTGEKSDDIGSLVFKSKIQLSELANHQASLEEVFLEITGDSQEYKAGAKEEKK